MASKEIFFADAESSLEEAYFVISGVPFDGTCSFRKGSRLAPKGIREESYNHETYLFEHDTDLEEVPFHDLGDLKCENLEDMMGGVGNTVEKILKDGKFPITIGGEHSLTPPAVRKFDNVGVVILDAHLDFRNQYLDERNSHACATRRVVDLVGIENVITLGIRSMEKEEKEEAEYFKLNWIHANRLRELGIEKILKPIEWDRVYLSIDMDFFDPSFAPGVGNPEYFGFSPQVAKEAINILAPRIVGFDVCEACPPYDYGNTCSLAARLIREVIGSVWKKTLEKHRNRYQKS
ncbi:MAG: agmatinase [Thermoplasmata archaeon]|nr:MAG: agmatinase [Thermoplasmata archaeon]